MKTILMSLIFFCAIALPVLGDLTESDLNKIRSILNEELKPIRADIVTLQTDFAWMRGKFESVDKQFESVDKQFESVSEQFKSVRDQITHVTYITYGLIALIVAAITVPQILIALHSGRDRALERQVEMLTQEIETLKQQRIVNP